MKAAAVFVLLGVVLSSAGCCRRCFEPEPSPYYYQQGYYGNPCQPQPCVPASAPCQPVTVTAPGGGVPATASVSGRPAAATTISGGGVPYATPPATTPYTTPASLGRAGG
jgi:hypothetical protein